VATAITVGAGRRALLRSTFDLAADFPQADATNTSRAFVQQRTRVDLLVLEDFGMKKIGWNATEDLLEVFVRRHETASRPDHDEPTDAGLGHLPRGRPRRDGDPQSLPRPCDHRPSDGQELSTATAHDYHRRLRP
jgi:hypothetical protein